MKMFPIQPFFGDKATKDLSPKEIPYVLVEAHEAQAKANHWQTVKRLAERGGLSPCELIAVLEDREWYRMDHLQAINQVKAYIAAHPVEENE